MQLGENASPVSATDHLPVVVIQSDETWVRSWSRFGRYSSLFSCLLPHR